MGFSIDRYLGRWYEIGKTPLVYEDKCESTTTDYLLVDNTIVVLTSCYVRGIIVKQNIGFATPDTEELNIQFKYELNETDGECVNYSPSKYIVLWTDYDNWSIVGSDGKVWILCRRAKVKRIELGPIADKIQSFGYDISRIKVNKYLLD